MEMLIVDSAESVIQKRKSEPYSADQNEWHVTISGKMNIFNFQQGTGLECVFYIRVCVWGWGVGLGERERGSSWEVLVLPVIFIKPGPVNALFNAYL